VQQADEYAHGLITKRGSLNGRSSVHAADLIAALEHEYRPPARAGRRRR
jgi:hypothetical protein